MLSLPARERGNGHKRVGVEFETELTTKLHYDDVVAEKQSGEGSFGIVFKGTFRGNDVAVKKMKEVGASADSLDEFVKEVDMLGKFRCDEIVHFFGACFIPNHVMLVTEFVPCKLLADATKERPEQPETVKARHWACTPEVADAKAKSLTTSVAPRDLHPRRRRRVVRRTARLALLDDNADHTRRATQPAARRDADVAPVVNAHDRAGIAKHMSALMSLAVASSRSYPARKTGVVVVSLTFIADDQSYRLCLSPPREGVEFRSNLNFLIRFSIL